MLGRVFLGLTSTKLGLMCLAQGHNAMTTVRLKLVALRSRVKHSTTDSLRSPQAVPDMSLTRLLFCVLEHDLYPYCTVLASTY